MYRGHHVLTLAGPDRRTDGRARAHGPRRVPRRRKEQGGVEHLHLVAEALRAAFLHRFSQLADHTTHLNAIDKDRTMVALTQTLGQGFGSGFVPKGTGVVLVDGMTWFDPVPDIRTRSRPASASSGPARRR